MNRITLLVLGIVATFLFAFFGINLIPKFILDEVKPQGTLFPYSYSDAALRGRKIYVREGCLYCHTQQIRPKADGSDIARGWGTRQTVADDYVHDVPVLLGTMRTGPDLSNIGIRQPSDSWHLLHLYNPRIVSPDSIMPPFPWLFQEQEKYNVGKPLELPPKYAPKDGKQVIPTQAALDLVEYLKSLKRDYKVKAVP